MISPNGYVLTAEELDELEGILPDSELDELRRLRGVLAGELTIPYCPKKPTEAQMRFLMLTCEEALYGGAAGGGKSVAMLMAALMYVDIPGYNALLLRKSLSDLNLPGALITMSHEWLANTDAKWDKNNHKWTFPSGATLTFGYLETDKDVERYQGANFDFIGFDEAGQHNEYRINQMRSRLRKDKSSKVPLRMRYSANPGGSAHDYLKKSFVDPTTAKYKYVPANVYDNPYLDGDDYAKRLEGLDNLTRDRLLKGLWVHDGEGLVYRCPEAAKVAEVPHDPSFQAVIGIDLGSSERKKTTGFAVVLWSRTRLASYIVEAWAEAGQTPASIAETCMSLMEQYGEDSVLVMDAGALGAGYVREMQLRYKLPAIAAKKSDKKGFTKIINGDLENGRIFVHENGASELIKEWGILSWDSSGNNFERKHDDHISDAALYACRHARNWFSEEPGPETSPSDPNYIIETRRRRIEAELAEIARNESGGWWNE